MSEAMLRHLYRREIGRFARMLYLQGDGSKCVDATIDSSLYGLFSFGVFKPDRPEVMDTMQAVAEQLRVRTPVGGVARYMDDGYYRVGHDLERVPGNPWFICTLWTAQWWIALARTANDLARPRAFLEWVACWPNSWTPTPARRSRSHL